MNVRQGPETVFDRPVEQILPELAGATATRENGRVGNELVFWSYRLADGRNAYLFACAPLEGVDCDTRAQAICPSRTQVIERVGAQGLVRHLRCSSMAVPKAGDLHPGCLDNIKGQDLVAGLVQCQ